jgi:hypothetical protein
MGRFILALVAACAGQPLADGADLKATPRADQNLELLALSVSGTVVARQDVYDRVVRDVSAIRAATAEVQGIGYFPRNDGKSLILGVDSATAASIEAGAYHAWDALNARWRVVEKQKVTDSGVLLLRFRGIYDMSTVAQQYASLSGVRSAEPDGIIGDDSTICLTIEGSAYRFVFDRAGGDCPSGCIDHHESGFTTDAAGSITPESTWDSTNASPQPDFIRRFGRRAGTSCALH